LFDRRRKLFAGRWSCGCGDYSADPVLKCARAPITDMPRGHLAGVLGRDQMAGVLLLEAIVVDMAGRVRCDRSEAQIALTQNHRERERRRRSKVLLQGQSQG
jgi:hypothetical protein